MVEIEVEFDTEKDEKFNMVATLDALKQKCEDYIRQFDPHQDTDDSLPF
jgi:6-pyruvoyl-tetrahydropterin synthase